jgi:uncharacterized protein YeaO (DUF488 family)
MRIVTKRVYEAATRDDGFRVLVDRVWPRGMSKEEAAVDLWDKELAPSTELRKWFNHDPARWEEFQRRYRKELEGRKAALEDLASKAGQRKLTLVFGARDTEHNQAIVLRDVLSGL